MAGEKTKVESKVGKGKGARKQMVPYKQFVGIMNRHGIARKQQGCQTLLNEFLEEQACLLVKAAALHCDARHRNTLTAADAKAAIAEMRTIPTGLY